MIHSSICYDKETFIQILNEINPLFLSTTESNTTLSRLEKFIVDDEIDELVNEIKEISLKDISLLSEEKIKELQHKYAGILYYSEEEIYKISSIIIKNLLSSENYKSIVKQIETLAPLIKKEVERVHQIRENISLNTQWVESTTDLIRSIATELNLNNIQELESVRIIYFKDWVRESIATLIFDQSAEIASVVYSLILVCDAINKSQRLPSPSEKLKNNIYALAEKIVEIKTPTV